MYIAHNVRGIILAILNSDWSAFKKFLFTMKNCVNCDDQSDSASSKASLNTIDPSMSCFTAAYSRASVLGVLGTCLTTAL